MTSPNKASCLVDLLTIVDSACFRNLPGARGHTGVGYGRIFVFIAPVYGCVVC